jgi:magnesium chelatase subunit H
MRKRTSPDNDLPIRVVFVTLDNHVAAAVDDARRALQTEMPGLTFTVHAATDWADNPDKLARCRDAIRAGDIIVVSMIFVEEHVKAIADVLEERHLECDAMVCCMSAGTIMKYTAMGRFRMSGEQKGPLALLKNCAAAAPTVARRAAKRPASARWRCSAGCPSF